jgi:hypothetical protein
MLHGIRSRLSYANVMATGAMFVALGGGAYALSGVPDGGGVFHGCVATSGALRVVARASLCRKAKTVKRGNRHVRIPAESAISWNRQGQPGVNGVNGINGANGATNVTVRVGSTTTSNAAAASCNPGERATGGGGTGVSNTDPLAASVPFVNGSPDVAGKTANGWEITTNTAGAHTAYVVCASP